MPMSLSMSMLIISMYIPCLFTCISSCKYSTCTSHVHMFIFL
jgi:hypothetical protein